ncbi:mediator of RNA polymerase II transcription subunit 8 [Kluyveromyces marxianus]|uniref:Mediator of RNA polymerase II transcription subunit 8 n=2 Tax=Kluyveromyces marxianus TaxID=4911 RepID=W0T8I2_KLUMD|nr:mediator of RNA polymerase II transcription subunit 8 [Kluyveromyces marxianus DMKU3-1042]QGN13434.1 mediator of RNA polymerase II transcription subunit 8 [Kluyveromyces marxianus]BAO38389.1 mediator of RNA polymerase II transcription subunit 8 [Kluyveromyces marxianus DMKU3-1042]BAP69946.1 mediator of RNA polymerase II transcription subunit 8 [Kluyveromyces marxianus]
MSDTPSNADPLQSSVSADFSNVPTQALDALRMKLSQLTASLAKIRDEMSKAELPQWYSLQAQLMVTLTQLSSLTNTLDHYEETLDSTVAYPLPSFPTTAHEGLITTLMRKKNIPEVDEWIKDARETNGIDVENLSDEEIKKLINKDKDITTWATKCIIDERSKHSYNGLHSAKELKELSMDESSNIYPSSVSTVKTSRPFSVDKLLKFVHQGEI